MEQLAARFRVAEAEVRRHLTAVRRQARTTAASPAAGTGRSRPARRVAAAEKIEPCERELLELLLGHPECWPAAAARLARRATLSQACRQIYETCRQLLDAGRDARRSTD